MRWGGLAMLTAIFAVVAPSASAAEIIDEIPVNPQGLLYAIEPGGSSVWQTSHGSQTINELDPETGGVTKSFEHGYGTNWTPRGMTYHGGRVYVADGLSPMRLVSWDAESADTTDPGRVTSDNETNQRLGSNQAILRAESGGAGAIALGQSNKVATFNLDDLTTANPYYPHTIFGAGISDPNGVQTAFQACAYSGGGVIVGTPDSDCGFYPGRSGGDAGQLDYAIDTAFGPGGIYVLEMNKNALSFISLSGDGCPCASSVVSLPGGAGSFPFSIRRLPGSGNLLISSSGNRRIDEVTPAGQHVRSYGFGVRTGGSGFETCENDCQTGLPTATEPRSNFTRLDLIDGVLYAATPNDGSIQVISLDDGPRLDLSARPRRVKKGDKTKLTAELLPCDQGDEVQFQIKDGQAFDDLGQAKPVDGSCGASKSVKITKKSVFRAVAADPGGSTIATSPKVTVKLK